jgi:hypothetical protein
MEVTTRDTKSGSLYKTGVWFSPNTRSGILSEERVDERVMPEAKKITA